MPKRKDLPKIPKELHFSGEFNNPIKLKEEDKVYLDKLCPKKVRNPDVLDWDKPPLEGERHEHKMMTLAESIEDIGNFYRSLLGQTKYFPTKEQDDAFLKELRSVSTRLQEILKETIYGNRSGRGDRARQVGLSADTISVLKGALNLLQPDIDQAEKRNRPRRNQRYAAEYRCNIYDVVKETFKRYGLTPTYYEVEGNGNTKTKRSAFFQCLYITLQNAGDNMIENMDKVHEHCKQFLVSRPTQ